MTRPDDDADWLAAEPPLSTAMVAELQRLKRRARSRLVPIFLVTTLITGALVYKVAMRPAQHRARVVLAIQEGGEAQRDTLLPMRDLRAYVTTVLMPAAKLTALIEKHDLFPLRKKQGPEFALAELWDTIEVEVFRNYFLYDQDAQPRSARIAITVFYIDPDLSYEIARDLATIIIDGAAVERDRAARAMADEADRAMATTRARVSELEAQAAATIARAAAATKAGRRGLASALHFEATALEAKVHVARDGLTALARAASAEQLTAAVYQEGLSLDVSIVEERKPDTIGDRKYQIAVIAVVVFVGVLVVVSLLSGAFDNRIHELDDVSRLGIPVVGQVPGFPGDRVGSLRERGVKRRGVPLSWRA